MFIVVKVWLLKGNNENSENAFNTLKYTQIYNIKKLKDK